MDSIDPTESEHERKNRRLWEWNESMQDFFKAVRDNRPFLPASVISQVDSLMVTMRDEALNYEQFSEKSDTTYDY